MLTELKKLDFRKEGGPSVRLRPSSKHLDRHKVALQRWRRTHSKKGDRVPSGTECLYPSVPTTGFTPDRLPAVELKVLDRRPAPGARIQRRHGGNVSDSTCSRELVDAAIQRAMPVGPERSHTPSRKAADKRRTQEVVEWALVNGGTPSCAGIVGIDSGELTLCELLAMADAVRAIIGQLSAVLAPIQNHWLDNAPPISGDPIRSARRAPEYPQFATR